MAHLVEHVLRKLRAHACRWEDLPEVTVESAAVTDEQTSEWSDQMYDRDLREDRAKKLLVLVGLGGLLAAGFFGAATAKASPDVCASLAAQPTVGTVEELVLDLVTEGFAPGDAGEVIAISVLSRCPEYKPVLQRFVDAWAPKQQTTVGDGIGGRYPA